MTPVCCKKCKRFNRKDSTCKLRIALPIKKNSCKKFKMRILARFAQFLKDNGAADSYMLQGSQHKNFKVYSIDYLLFPGFAWKDSLEGDDYWYDLHNKWLRILREEYNID